jgi:DNA-binding transcriptional ArsR family regulator
MNRFSLIITLLIGFAVVNTSLAGMNYYAPSAANSIEHSFSSSALTGSIYGAGVPLIIEHSPTIASASWLLVGVLVVWKGRVRANWMKLGFDSDIFELFVLRRGATTRLRILSALSTPKNRLQIAHELHLNWRAIDRHLTILDRHELVNVQVAYGKVRMYSVTHMGTELIKLVASAMELPRLSNSKIETGVRIGLAPPEMA